MEEEALEKLTQIGSKSSLRYSVQLPTLAAQNTKTMKNEKVMEDVERVDKLFMDIGEAEEHPRKYEEKLMKR
jgi:TBP-interacting protein